MVDTFSKDERSKIMRSVKSSKNESTEIKMIGIFKENKIKGWKRNYTLFGNPDFVFPKQKVVVFTDGCFWHGHNCRNVNPSTNMNYWKKKISRNIKRDNLVNSVLSEKGWKIYRIWECEIKEKNPKKIDELLRLFI